MDNLALNEKFVTHYKFLANKIRVIRFEVEIEYPVYSEIFNWKNIFRKDSSTTEITHVVIKILENSNFIHRINGKELTLEEKSVIREIFKSIDKKHLTISEKARKVDLAGKIIINKTHKQRIRLTTRNNGHKERY